MIGHYYRYVNGGAFYLVGLILAADLWHLCEKCQSTLYTKTVMDFLQVLWFPSTGNTDRVGLDKPQTDHSSVQ
jgi:hypothetical protein